MARFKRLEQRPADDRHGQHRQVFRAAAAGALPRGAPRQSRCGCAWSATASRLVALMQAGEVDLAVMGRPPKEIATRAEAFAAHPLVFVAPPRTRCSAVGHPPVAALRGPRLHRARAGLGHARGDGGVLCRAPLRAPHHDGDVEQRDHQAGRDGRHGPELPVAAHDRPGAAQRAAAACSTSKARR